MDPRQPGGPLPETLRPLVEQIFGDQVSLVEDYVDLLAEEGTLWGLLGPREVPRLWDRHIVNSVCLMPLLPSGALVADLGSGAGLPGIPLALARPDLQIELVEPMARRVEFLELCVERLGLGTRVRVVRQRAQDYRGAEILVCRALSALSGLVEMVEHLVPPAKLYAIKGDRACQEIADAEDLLGMRGLVTRVLTPELNGLRLGTIVIVSG
ncbi:MAG: 16S rRNA (guanine(527)-N(7))-methyltransferase RsmG [Propionibacteriaceae bacterium]|nr:16S rRNA (guanine(527)-N(7))-methyltransferase RsmG [Propionibacteriaceae bacterium]